MPRRNHDAPPQALEAVLTNQDDAGATMPPACYLHPDRAALLRCSRCEQPICGSDAIEAPVGYQCTRCAAGGTPVRRLRDLAVAPRVTQTLVATIALIYIGTQVDPGMILGTFGLRPILVGAGEWWLVVTSGLLHAGLIHVAFNAILLWRLGEMLEPRLGHARFAALFGAGLVGGSLGVVLLAWLTVTTPIGSVPVLAHVVATHPASVTVGASGAVFGLMGAAMTAMRDRGVNPWRTDIGTLVLLNLALTFMVPQISVGGHLGGFLAGMAAGRLLLARRERTVLLVLLGIAGAYALTITLATMMNATLLSAIR